MSSFIVKIFSLMNYPAASGRGICPIGKVSLYFKKSELF
jgi:hypothetical protein